MGASTNCTCANEALVLCDGYKAGCNAFLMHVRIITRVILLCACEGRLVCVSLSIRGVISMGAASAIAPILFKENTTLASGFVPTSLIDRRKSNHLHPQS